MEQSGQGEKRSSACCCGSGKAGVKVIGWTYLIMSACMMAMSLLLLILHFIFINEDKLGTFWAACLVTFFAYMALECYLAITLLEGVNKNKEKLVRRWIVIARFKDLILPIIICIGILVSFPRFLFIILANFLVMDLNNIRIVNNYHEKMLNSQDQDKLLVDLA